MRLVVFDLDGTLVDSLADLHASVNHALAAVGLPPRTLEEVRGFVGEGARVLLARAVAPADHLVEPALAAWRIHYEAHCLDATRLYPGLASLLGGLAERRALAVLTNKPGALARDPTGLLSVLARAGAAASEAVLVGDSPVDVATARAAGIPMIGVTWGLGARAALAAAGAPALVDDAAALAAALG